MKTPNTPKKRKIEKMCRYSMDEIDAIIDEAESRIAEGIYITNDDFFNEWDEEIKVNEQIEEEKKLEIEMSV